MKPRWLIADIGGTNARFVLAESKWAPGADFAPISSIVLPTEDHPAFDDAMAAALEALEIEEPASLSVGIALAGPVVDGHGYFTNVDWTLDETALRERFGLKSVSMVNDLVAAVWGLLADPPTATTTRWVQQAPARPERRQALVNVGTGVGVAYWSDGLDVDSSEAGHTGFAPPSRRWQVFLRVLEGEFDRVSWEDVLAGPGISRIDSFVNRRPRRPGPEVVTSARAGETGAARSIAAFCELLGVYVGDLVLSAPAFGGVWLTGGVALAMMDIFNRAAFVDGLHAKGPMRRLLTDVPVAFTTDRELGLKGAWRLASNDQT